MIEKKKDISTIAEKNRTIENIIRAIDTRDGFLLVGHANPDEDCIASMVAAGLLLSKLSKQVYLLACTEIHRNFQYLLNICKYNSISILEDCEKVPETVTTLVILDTPKPAMLTGKESVAQLLEDKRIVKIEFDHHLAADSEYSGDPDYRLVAEASSTCELIGLFAFKLRNRKDIVERYQINEIFSRNFILAVLTGLIGDSQMGKFLKSNRERWFYRLFSSLFADMLAENTYKGSANFSNMEEVYAELTKLSGEEEQCFLFMTERKKASNYLRFVVLGREDSEQLAARFEQDIIVSIARMAADRLAEESGYVSLICYFENPATSSLIQFRMRRSQNYKLLDLRTLLSDFGIEDGGGHAGAIGFRIERGNVSDIDAFVRRIVGITEARISKAF